MIVTYRKPRIIVIYGQVRDGSKVTKIVGCYHLSDVLLLGLGLESQFRPFSVLFGLRSVKISKILKKIRLK